MSHIKLIAGVFSVTIAVLSVIPANASPVPIYGSVDITSRNNNYSDIGQLFSPALGSGSGGYYYTGIYSWTTGSTTGIGSAVPNWGFCIELSQDAELGVEDVVPLDDAPQPSTPMGITKANYIRELWGRDFDPAWVTGATSTDRQMAEAFSACIWEIINETDPVWDVTSGTGFSANGIEQAATANLWLSQLNGDSAYFANNLVAISSPTGQDYVVQIPVKDMIPEPATLSLLAVGATALLRRRKS